MVDLNELKGLMVDAEISNIEDIGNDTKIFEELNVDSLSIMKIICCFEDKYMVRFYEDQIDFKESLTIGELLDLLNSNLQH